jgi:hypothetical protein
MMLWAHLEVERGDLVVLLAEGLRLARVVLWEVKLLIYLEALRYFIDFIN